MENNSRMVEIDMDFFSEYFKEIQLKMSNMNGNTKQIISKLIDKTIETLDKKEHDFIGDLMIGLHEASHLIVAIYNPFFKLSFNNTAAVIASSNQQINGTSIVPGGVSMISGVLEDISSKRIPFIEAMLITINASIILEKYLFKVNTNCVAKDKDEVEQYLKILKYLDPSKSKNTYYQITENLIKEHRLKIFLVGLYLANYKFISKETLLKLCKII